MRERGRLADQIEGVRRLEQSVADAVELVELAEAEGDAATADAAVADLEALAAEAARRETESLLSGEADANDCFVEVNAGAGGTDAQDWAEMLLRMYQRWAEAHGCKVTLTEESAGEEAGIKSATIQVSGPNAYGWLKTETRRPPPGAHQPLRRQRQAADLLRLRLRLSGGGRPDRDRHQPGRPQDRHLPRLRRRRAARQQDRIRRALHPPPDRDRGRLHPGPQPAPQPRHRHGHAARPSLRAGAVQARGRAARRPRPARPTSAGATRSAPTCCSPTSS